MEKTTLCLFAIFSILVTPIISWKSYSIRLNSVKVFDPMNDTLEIKVILSNSSRGEQVFDAEFTIKKEITTLFIAGLAQIRNRNSEFVFMNKTVNVCKFFLESSTSPLMKSIYDEMIRRGLNINSCPVPPGSYFTSGFHVNDNKFPPILPTGRVFIKIDYLTGSSERNLKLLSSIELTATIKNSLSKALRIKG